MRMAFGIVGAVIATLLGIVVVVAVVAVALLPSGALNGLIEDAIAAEVGRPVQLQKAPSLGFADGALTLELGPLSIANADWAAERHADFARVRRFEASLRLLPLLSGKVELPAVTIEGPQLHLARAEDGEVNWPEGDDTDGGPVWVPEVENLVIRDAHVTYADAAAATNLELALDEATGRLGGDRDLALHATGRLQGEPLELDLTGGSVSELLGEGAMDEPATIEASIGSSRVSAQAASFADLEALDAKVEIQAEQTLTDILSRLGIKADLPPFEASATVEPGAEGSLITADLTIEGASAHIQGRVDDLAAPAQGFSADIRVQGSPAAMLAPAGIEVPEELPDLEFNAQVSGSDGALQVDPLEARLGDNTLSGQASARYAEALEELQARFGIDAPGLNALLASFDVPYADQIPSAQVDAEIAHDGDGTTFSANGTIGGDTLELQGGYQGALTAFANPRVDLHLEGSALGALPAQLGLARRPIDSYRVDLQVEERDKEASPVVLDAAIEDTEIAFDGHIDELRALQGVEGRLRIGGPNPAPIQKLFELPPTNLPPYAVAGRLAWRGDDIEITGLDGTFGDSDIRGEAAVDLGPEPPAVTADLQSDLLDLDDLAGLIGAPPAIGEDETASPAQERLAESFVEDEQLLPVAEIDAELWQNLDVNVRYNADRIESEFLPIDRLRTEVESHQGWLTVDPLVTGLADGSIVGFASVDGTQDPVAGDFDIRIDALQLQDMLAKLGVEGEGFGELNGRIRLEGQGRSVDALLGSADGQIVLSMAGGGLDSLILEAIGLDVGESIVVLLDSMAQTEEDKTPIRCAIVNLQVDQGVATARPVVIDTVDSKITVDGTINLKDETLDIFIESRPKDPSLLSGNQPIHIDGPLLSPSVNPAPGEVESEALGWLLAPLAAVLPFFDVGAEEDSPCGSLLAQAKEAAAAQPED